MSEQREVVILSGVRTAIGDYGGSLKDIAPSELAARVVKEAVSRAKVDPKDVGQCVFGNVIHTEPKDMYISRLACVNGGLPHDTGALTLNRLCGSGLQAIVSASQYILLGDTDAAVAGGAESMSRAAYASTTQRWGARMGETKAFDMMVGALTDPFDTMHIGVTAENVAAKCGLTREQQDAFAVESHKRATAALAAGHFKSQILPVELKGKKGPVMFDTDEHVRADATLEGDGQAARRLHQGKRHRHRRQRVGHQRRGRSRRADGKGGRCEEGPEAHGPARRVRPRGHRPQDHGARPGPAVKRALAKAGLKLDQMDVIESNEAFAAQALGVSEELGMDPKKVNPNGGAVALGHPIGATGAILTVKAMYELHRTGGRYGLITMCIGGGQGIAAIIERI